MHDYTVKADVDTMLRANDKAGIRSAIGVGTTDAPTFLALTAGTGLAKLEYTVANGLTLKRSSDGAQAITLNAESNMITAGSLVANNGIIRNGANNTIFELGTSGTVEQRNGTNAQAFRVYNTYGGVGGVDYERGFIRYATGFLEIGYEFGGLGGTRDVQVTGPKHIWLNAGAAGVVGFKTAGVFRAYFDNFGHFRFNADNTYDIGLSSTDRPRNVYAAGVIQAGNSITCDSVFGSRTGSVFFGGTDGNMRLTNNAGTDFGRLQLGGTTSAFPAIKRNGTGIDIVLADNSAFAPVKGKITTATAYTATVVAATGYITLYDSTGTAYRVPCAV